MESLMLYVLVSDFSPEKRLCQRNDGPNVLMPSVDSGRGVGVGGTGGMSTAA